MKRNDEIIGRLAQGELCEIVGGRVLWNGRRDAAKNHNIWNVVSCVQVLVASGVICADDGIEIAVGATEMMACRV
jgi:hypothetical protein